MSRTENLDRWRRVAEGDIDDALMHWLQERAAAIVQADGEPAGSRPDAVVRAAGLAYRADHTAHVRRAVETVRDFPLLDEQGNVVEPRRGQSTRIDVDAARAVEPAWADLSDDEIRKRVSRMFARTR